MGPKPKQADPVKQPKPEARGVQFHLIVPSETTARVLVVGSTPQLGDWRPQNAPEVLMTQTAVPSVRSSEYVPIPSEPRQRIKFKLVHEKPGYFSSDYHWEDDPDRFVVEHEHQFCFSFRPAKRRWDGECCSQLAACAMSSDERVGVFTEFLLTQFLAPRGLALSDGGNDCVNERVRTSADALTCLFKQAVEWERSQPEAAHALPKRNSVHALMCRLPIHKMMDTAKHFQNGLAALLCMVAGQRMGGLHEELEGSSDWIAEILPNIQLALCEEQLPSAEKDGALKAVDWMVSHNRRSGGLESEPFVLIAHANNTHCCCAALRSPLRVYVDSLGPCSVDGSTSSCSHNGSSAL